MEEMINAMRAMGIYTEEQIQESIKAMQALGGAGAMQENPVAKMLAEAAEDEDDEEE